MSEADLEKSAIDLLAAAYDYWKVAHKEGISGALLWLEDDDGKVVIFTRGEYRQALFENVDKLGQPVHFFALSEEEAGQ